MQLKLHRKYFKDSYTIGDLYVDNIFFCNTLEDKNRDLNKNGKFDNGEVKVANETCIPFGTYKITIETSPKFKRELPLLHDVPHFTGILIHRGNSAEDSSGCVLLGENREVGKVLNSAPYEQVLVNIIKHAIAKGEEVSITIV